MYDIILYYVRHSRKSGKNMCAKAASSAGSAIRLVPWSFGANFERFLFIWIVLRFAETKARPAAVLVDEFDPGYFQGTPS